MLVMGNWTIFLHHGCFCPLLRATCIFFYNICTVYSNIFSETSGPIKTKFHKEPPCEGKMNSIQCHMTKILSGKSSQGHDLYKHCKLKLHSLTLYAKFQNHRPSGSGEQDFYRCLLFIAMAVILVMLARKCIYNFVSHLVRWPHMKFGFDYANSFRVDV